MGDPDFYIQKIKALGMVSEETSPPHVLSKAQSPTHTLTLDDNIFLSSNPPSSSSIDPLITPQRRGACQIRYTNSGKRIQRVHSSSIMETSITSNVYHHHTGRRSGTSFWGHTTYLSSRHLFPSSTIDLKGSWWKRGGGADFFFRERNLSPAVAPGRSRPSYN